MEINRPSRTAQGAALHRAAHQLLDYPPVFEDPLALRIIGGDAEAELRAGRDPHVDARARGLRALIVARSRFTEDSLAEAVGQGVCQYVLLGAGLDTFAYRAAQKFPELAIFEVDHPATLGWKRERLEQAGIGIPNSLTYAPVNFESQTLADGLTRAGFDESKAAIFAWLGVVPYLTREAVMSTLAFIARMPRGSAVVFDYAEPIAEWDVARRAALEAMAARVAAIGEPFRSFFEPQALASDVAALGFSRAENFDGEVLNARYFANRADGLKLPGRAHLTRASV